MIHLGTAFRAFFGTLFNDQKAALVKEALEGKSAAASLPAPAAHETSVSQATPPARSPVVEPSQNPAVTFLSMLQREARFVDFLQEDLGGFDDAQIGAVARDIHRDCRTVVKRVFALERVESREEGSRVTIDATQARQWKVTGKVEGGPPFTGAIVHSGWRATRCELPQYAGSVETALLITPAELEV